MAEKLMITFIVRSIKRFAVLVPGLLIAYISIRDIFPNLNKQLPIGLAILATYILAAYVLIPALIRLLRVVWPPKHPPTYCITPDGFASDPINVGLVGSRAQVIKAMEAAGWTVADRYSFYNVFKEVLATVSHHHYSNAPMSPLYLFGRRQDIGFEIQLNGSRGQRHHVRFWVTGYDPTQSPIIQPVRWRTRKSKATELHPLWLGAASRDIGFALIRHNVQITHMIHPNTDDERDLIVRGLSKAKKVTKVETPRLNEPYRVINRTWRGYLESDGVMAICHLKD